MNVRETPLRQEGCPVRIVSVLPNFAAVLSSWKGPIEKIRASNSEEVAQLVTFGRQRRYVSWFEGGELECRVGREAVLSLKAE